MTKTEDVKQRVDQAKQLISAGQAPRVERLLGPILEDHPGHIDLLYVLSVSHRYSGNNAAALRSIRELLTYAPEYGRAYQEEAYNLRDAGDHFEAARSFERAVALDPTLVASWRALEEIYTASGNDQQRANAVAQQRWFEHLPPQLQTAAGLIGEGRLQAAEEQCRNFCLSNPTHIEGMRLLAQIGVRLKVYDDAEYLLETILYLAPDHKAARFEYASVLRRRNKFRQATEQIKMLVDSDPDDISYLALSANIATATGEHNEALALYRRLLERVPDKKRIHLACGHALKTVGRTDEAIHSYRAACAADTSFGDAYWSLANLKTYKFTGSEVSLAEDHVVSPTTSFEDRVHLHFALGKHFEDNGFYEQAFTHYDQGNRLKRVPSRYSIEKNRTELHRIIAGTTSRLFERDEVAGFPANDPIFIVGMPRAGSTLVEQILASHSLVDGTSELPNIVSIAHGLNGRRFINEVHAYPGVLSSLEGSELAILGQRYIEETAIFS